MRGTNRLQTGNSLAASIKGDFNEAPPERINYNCFLIYIQFNLIVADVNLM